MPEGILTIGISSFIFFSLVFLSYLEICRHLEGDFGVGGWRKFSLPGSFGNKIYLFGSDFSKKYNRHLLLLEFVVKIKF
jgi:hypothetical protein